MSWVPYEQCHCIITLANRNCYEIDWVRWPELYWVVSNRTEWLCGTNLWPRHPPEWTGQYPRILLDARLFESQFKYGLSKFTIGTSLTHQEAYISLVWSFCSDLCVCVFRRIGVYNHSYWSLNKLIQQVLNNDDQAYSLMTSEVFVMKKNHVIKWHGPQYPYRKMYVLHFQLNVLFLYQMNTSI